MTELEAIASTRARWAHPPIDLRDVEERVACRLAERPELEAAVVPVLASCRLFVRRRGRALVVWCSRYVHAPGEVDVAIGWILARLEVLEREADERERKRAEREAAGAPVEESEAA